MISKIKLKIKMTYYLDNIIVGNSECRNFSFNALSISIYEASCLELMYKASLDIGCPIYNFFIIW